ncbi:30S ribosomal protein S8 [Chlamydiales bacterium STE3]|uniref:Small ribosomal subunit protein uS8 n=1 Tax=Chlamydiales bacterium STE3 TaxID=1910938 RepID=A0A1K0IT41_9CHLA|nr:30S ribosomal protein S8 [Chlamydiales bacterium STE3]SDA08617.1 30S ribosomal protein S8 [Chlamydiales bacterium STE3]
MAVSDPIADFLTRIRNASRSQHRYVDVSWSKMKQYIAEILKNRGFIENYLVKVDDHRGTMRLFLKYTQGRKEVIQGLKRVSRPGLRKYVRSEEIPNFFGGKGLSIVSTSQGVIPGSEAKSRKIGGELICLVW